VSFLEKRPAQFKNKVSSDMPDYFRGGTSGVSVGVQPHTLCRRPAKAGPITTGLILRRASAILPSR